MFPIQTLNYEIVPFIESHLVFANPLWIEAYYPDLWEDDAGVLARMKLFPEGCLSLFVDGVYAGWMFCHPWRGQKAPLILSPDGAEELLSPIYDYPDCFYIHDTLVAKQYRGMGLGTALAQKALSLADHSGFESTYLISVHGSDTFWTRHGFMEVERFSYGPMGIPAKLMVRECR